MCVCVRKENMISYFNLKWERDRFKPDRRNLIKKYIHIYQQVDIETIYHLKCHYPGIELIKKRLTLDLFSLYTNLRYTFNPNTRNSRLSRQ